MPSTIRAFFLAPLVRELARHGIEIDGFLREYGLSAAQLTSLYERVPLQNFVGMAEDLARRLNRPFLGLELGQRASIADLGPFYAVFVLARDLSAALGALARYQSTWQTNTLLEIVRGKETSACRYLIQDPAIWPRRQDAEFALATMTAFVRQVTSSRWRPVAVEFEHDIKGRATVLRQFFKAPVTGNRPANLLIISRADMEQPQRWRGDSESGDVAPILEQHLRELLGPPAEASPTYVARVGALVARRVGRADVTFDGIATEMNMSVRSLRRRLMQEGSSFRKILRLHRKTLMESVLRTDDARLAELAGRLNYSDGAVLSRAFKSWTGMSPRQFVKSRRD
ncbi:MAG: AraC family transcriptional regulator [Gammaproteobacteria bacterium]